MIWVRSRVMVVDLEFHHRRVRAIDQHRQRRLKTHPATSEMNTPSMPGAF